MLRAKSADFFMKMTHDLERLRKTVDLTELFPRSMSIVAAQMVIGLTCSAAAILTREVVDLAMPGAGPFALTMPFVLFATLFARWQAGTFAMAMLALHAWYFVLPSPGSFRFDDPTDGPRVFVNVLAGVAVIALGEVFRRVVQEALQDRDRVAQERLLLLQELDHRVKNNFAIVSAMMRTEMRSSKSEELAKMLHKLSSRVDSIARAHGALYRGETAMGQVEMNPYLEALCHSLEGGYFCDRNVTLNTDVEDISCDRDAAISIGLVINELCTNASKHAFVGDSEGRLLVQLKRVDKGILVVVEDDGVGLANAQTADTLQGGPLLRAFAQQAGGELRHVPTKSGTRFEMVTAAH